MSLKERLQNREGATLVELIIYMAILAVVATAIFPLLFSSTEDRLLQQTISYVEQNGTQLLQTIGYHTRNSERILSPALGATGSILTLQMSSGSLNPTIVGFSGGTLLLVQGSLVQDLSSSQVAISNFRVKNTSVSSSRQSVEVSFTITRTIRLQAPRTYRQSFQGTFVLYPNDSPQGSGSGCGCAVPGCSIHNTYVWQVCEEGECLTTETPMQCP